MTEPPTLAPEGAAADPDPAIAALLDFEPVVRRCRRHDGWTEARQRGFVAALARLGEIERAAESVGRTASGAWTVRNSPGAAGFSDAWDAALDLFHARNPLLSARGGRARRYADQRAAGPAADWAEEDEAAGDEGGIPTIEMDELMVELLERYRKKLQQERQCRLAGRIVEADYYVRQLTFLEIAFDIGGSAHQLHDLLKSGDLDILKTIGTPMSVYLDRLRRDLWREQGEPDRMPAPLLGEHDENGATGHRSRHYYDAAKDGDYDEWRARMAAIEALQAEAQALWEEKAAADAAEWAERVKRAEGEAVWARIRADEAAWEEPLEGEEEEENFADYRSASTFRDSHPPRHRARIGEPEV